MPGVRRPEPAPPRARGQPPGRLLAPRREALHRFSGDLGRPASLESPGMDWDGATYDRVSTPQARWGRAVLERLELDGDETVVDAGCGTGRVTEALLARLPRG